MPGAQLVQAGVAADLEAEFELDAALGQAGGAALLMKQLASVGIVVVWSVVATAILAYAIKATIGLRPAEDVERQGLDINEHGEEGYTA